MVLGIVVMGFMIFLRHGIVQGIAAAFGRMRT
jgi:hypothetical protein